MVKVENYPNSPNAIVSIETKTDYLEKSIDFINNIINNKTISMF